MTSLTTAQTGTFLRNVALLLTVIFSALPAFGDHCGVQLAIFDFTPQSKDGALLADAVRMKLSRLDDSWQVIDTQSMLELNLPSPSIDIAPTDLVKQLKKINAEACVFGSLTKDAHGKYVAEIRILESFENNAQISKHVFTDNSQRWKSVIAQKILNTLMHEEGDSQQYTDSPFPTADELEGPINANPSFESVDGAGWEAPDNVACFIDIAPVDNRILRMRTDIDRDAYLAYRKALLAGEASPDSPPQVKSASSVNSIATQEGVHFKSDFLPADVNAAYWLSASYRFLPAKGFAELASPMVFIKGFKSTPAAFDGLPESSLKKLKMTPAEFTALPQEKRRELITADARKNPKKYLRECYRWQMACVAGKKWKTHSAKFPPAGKLPADVQFLQIQIYSYAPPGQYFWDNVALMKQKTAPVPEKRK